MNFDKYIKEWEVRNERRKKAPIGIATPFGVIWNHTRIREEFLPIEPLPPRALPIYDKDPDPEE